jgi:hypothetical protein
VSAAVTEHAVTALLQGVGIQPTFQSPNIWFVQVAVQGNPTPVFLTVQANAPYFYIAAPIFESGVHAMSLDEMDALTLRRLMRLNSDGLLAKITYSEFKDGSHLLVATSGCAVEQVTGEKLRRRIEACAELARKVVEAFK